MWPVRLGLYWNQMERPNFTLNLPFQSILDRAVARQRLSLCCSCCVLQYCANLIIQYYPYGRLLSIPVQASSNPDCSCHVGLSKWSHPVLGNVSWCGKSHGTVSLSFPKLLRLFDVFWSSFDISLRMTLFSWVLWDMQNPWGNLGWITDLSGTLVFVQNVLYSFILMMLVMALPINHLCSTHCCDETSISIWVILTTQTKLSLSFTLMCKTLVKPFL